MRFDLNLMRIGFFLVYFGLLFLLPSFLFRFCFTWVADFQWELESQDGSSWSWYIRVVRQLMVRDVDG